MQNNKTQNTETNIPPIERPALVFGTIMHWTTILSCVICSLGPAFIFLFPQNNVLDPNLIFSTIWQGGKVAAVWGGTIPQGHWYISNLFTGDGFTMFGIALGCASALIGFIPTAIMYFKRKNYIFTIICLILIMLIVLAMSGILAME